MNETKTTLVMIPMPGIDYLLSTLNGNEFKLLIFLWRWTVGVDADAVKISFDDMTALTKINRSTLSKAINRLIELELVAVNKNKGRPFSYHLMLSVDLPENYERPKAMVNQKWL